MAEDSIRDLADEVAEVMASRLGGAPRGAVVDLPRMMRRRGGALPRRLRRKGAWLAEASVLAGSPRIARQLDLREARAAHRALLRHLRPLGETARLTGGVLNIAASVMMGLLVLGGLTVWYLVHSGRL